MEAMDITIVNALLVIAIIVNVFFTINLLKNIKLREKMEEKILFDLLNVLQKNYEKLKKEIAELKKEIAEKEKQIK